MLPKKLGNGLSIELWTLGNNNLFINFNVSLYYQQQLLWQNNNFVNVYAQKYFMQ